MPGWKDIDPEARTKLLERKRAREAVENLAEEVGMRPTTLDRRLREWATHLGGDKKMLRKHKILQKRWDSPPVFDGNAVITGDYHMPFVDYDFTEVMMNMAYRTLDKPRRLVIAGDLFNMDAFSVLPRMNYYTSFRTELNSASVLLDDMLDVFDEIFILLGNHERRFIYMTFNELSTRELEALIGIGAVKLCEYSHAIVRTELGDWRVTHQKNYSVKAQSVGVKLAHKFQQHVITHHQHIVSKGFDTSGNFVVIDNGCMADPAYFDYAYSVDNTRPVMKQSFTIIRNGSGILVANDEAFNDLSLLS